LQKIFIITGHTGCGKTSLMTVLSKDGWKIISAGKIFSDISKLYNVGQDRLSIQEFAIGYFKKNGYSDFSRMICNEVGDAESVIIEGLRPLEVVKQIRLHFRQVIIIFIDTKKEIRAKRLTSREKYSSWQIEQIQNHAIEQELNNVRDAADYIVENNLDLDYLISNVKRILCLG